MSDKITTTYLKKLIKEEIGKTEVNEITGLVSKFFGGKKEEPAEAPAPKEEDKRMTLSNYKEVRGFKSDSGIPEEAYYDITDIAREMKKEVMMNSIVDTIKVNFNIEYYTRGRSYYRNLSGNMLISGKLGKIYAGALPGPTVGQKGISQLSGNIFGNQAVLDAVYLGMDGKRILTDSIIRNATPIFAEKLAKAIEALPPKKTTSSVETGYFEKYRFKVENPNQFFETMMRQEIESYEISDLFRGDIDVIVKGQQSPRKGQKVGWGRMASSEFSISKMVQKQLKESPAYNLVREINVPRADESKLNVSYLKKLIKEELNKIK